jgi:hypothetical protein
MSLIEDTNPRTLKELLGDIDWRRTALPDFQHNFVWEPTATKELIVSIAKGFPAGSILRVRDEKRIFAAREFAGAPKLDGHKHTFLVLDGQQRLTSLYQAFFGVGEYRYYLDLKMLIDGKDFEEAISYERAKSKIAAVRESFERQARELVLPLSVLREGAGQFFEWTHKVANSKEAGDGSHIHDDLYKISEQWLRPIGEYQFPVVTLSNETGLDALCSIFETLNNTGVKLGAFELLTATLWPKQINLRDRWKVAQRNYSIIEDFKVDPYYVLQAISLASRDRPSCKRGDVLKLQAEDIETWWDGVTHGLAVGLEILHDDCKVLLPKWLPYQTMLVPLAAVLAKSGLPKGPEAGAHKERLKQWFWCAVFGQAYENSSNSQSAKDFSELVRWLGGGSAPETVSTMRFDPGVLRDVTPRQRSLYCGTICLILSGAGGARDFHSTSFITRKLINEQGIDDHHIFPANYLEKNGINSSRLRDCVLNRTLIDRETNQTISNHAPSDYFKAIRKTPDFPFDSVLASHCLPTGADSPFWNDDYEAFLGWRQRKLWEEIKRVTGIGDVADLESEAEAA